MEELGIEKKEEIIELTQSKLRVKSSNCETRDLDKLHATDKENCASKDTNMFDKLEESKDDTKANITGKLESMSKDLEYESFDDKHVKQENKSKNNYTKEYNNQNYEANNEVGKVQENIDEENNSNASSNLQSKNSHSFCTGNSSIHEVPSEPLLAKHVKCSYCNKCNMKRPMRTHHCSICNKCVLRMDHHCAWIANCVGINNHKFYVLFLIYTSLLGCCITILDFFTCCNLYFEKVKLFSFDFLYYLLFTALSLIVAFLTGNLALYQLKLIMLDRTTLEDITNQFKVNQIKDFENAKYVMGNDVYLWWIPIKQKLKPPEESSLLD